ncbi:MAG: DUF2953 domain-containing protein [Clostridiales bacterium]|nr:DUF2953 domain-containing protein [Clostridiales bacterium]
MVFLYIILSIIFFLVLLLCIKITVATQYNEDFELEVRWLFIKYKLYPPKEKKPKKEKKEDSKDNKKDKKPKKAKKPNPLKKFYENQGMTGVIDLISATASVVNGRFKRIFKSVVINSLVIAMQVTGEDSAKTAMNYGEVCAAVFPAVGLMCSTMRVKRYKINITPDFIGSENKAYFSAVISVIPIRIVNAAIIFLFQFLFKVLAKLLLGGRKDSVKK